MKKIKLESGLIAWHCSDAEIKQTLDILSTNTSLIGQTLKTPRTNLKYIILNEIETSFEKYNVTIKANGQIKTIKTTLCNQDEKIIKIVYKMYNL